MSIPLALLFAISSGILQAAALAEAQPSWWMSARYAASSYGREGSYGDGWQVAGEPRGGALGLGLDF